MSRTMKSWVGQFPGKSALLLALSHNGVKTQTVQSVCVDTAMTVIIPAKRQFKERSDHKYWQCENHNHSLEGSHHEDHIIPTIPYMQVRSEPKLLHIWLQKQLMLQWDTMPAEPTSPLWQLSSVPLHDPAEHHESDWKFFHHVRV